MAQPSDGIPEKEAWRPNAHVRMTARLIKALDASYGIKALFKLRQSFGNDDALEARADWNKAFLGDDEAAPNRKATPRDIWAEAIANSGTLASLDCFCFLETAKELAGKLWLDTCFKEPSSTTFLAKQPAYLSRMLQDVLYLVPPTYMNFRHPGEPRDALAGRDDHWSRDNLRDAVAAFRLLLDFDRLPASQRPTEEEIYKIVADQLNANRTKRKVSAQKLKALVERFRAERGDFDDFEYIEEDDAFERLTLGYNASDGGHFAYERALSETLGYLRDCFGELQQKEPLLAQAIDATFPLTGQKRTGRRPSRANVMSGQALLRDCIERKASDIAY